MPTQVLSQFELCNLCVKRSLQIYVISLQLHEFVFIMESHIFNLFVIDDNLFIIL